MVRLCTKGESSMKRQGITPRKPDEGEFLCSKCNKDMTVPTHDGDIPVIGILVGADILKSGEAERDEATMAGLELQFGRYDVGHYLFCMECVLKAMSRDNLPF